MNVSYSEYDTNGGTDTTAGRSPLVTSGSIASRSIGEITPRWRFIPNQLDNVGSPKTTQFLTDQPPTTASGTIIDNATTRQFTSVRSIHHTTPATASNQSG